MPLNDHRVRIAPDCRAGLQVAYDGYASVVEEVTHSPGTVDTSAKTFEAGLVLGRSYVFDYRVGQIVCGGELVATNSGTVGYTTSAGSLESIDANGATLFDLDAQTLQAGIDALVKAGPPVAGAEYGGE